MNNPYIIESNGKRFYLKLDQSPGGGITQLTGDGAAGPGSGSQGLTLATVNPNVGSFGDATHVAQILVDGKGRILAVTSVPISGGGGGGITQLTGDGTAGPGSGSQALALTAVNSNVGTWGDSTHVPQFVVDAKGRILSVGNVAISGGGGSVATSMPIASTLGVLDNGSDQTSNLNAIFSNAAYSGIVIDFSNPGSVTINGAVNCQGKTIRFAPGNKLTGTGSISNFILDCGLKQWCFDIGTTGAPALTVDPIGTTLSVISPWAFGANDSGSDVARYFQATSDCCIRNGAKISKIIVPTGTYVLGSPWILYKLGGGGTTYVFFLLTIEGENTFSSADGFGSILNFSSRRNSFGIGIHQGKGCEVNNIKLIGGFNYTFPGALVFYALDFNTINDGVSRDTSFSPNAAINIDPFGPSIPADGGYPGNDAYGTALSTYYKGNTNGSTGISIRNCFAATWVIGLITSCNGQTVNAELLGGLDFQVQNVKIGFASCQSQEKLNIVHRLESWGLCGCVFVTGSYGAGSPGSWWVEYVNIAGLSLQFVSDNQTGYFPSYFSNIYAESLGTFGPITSINGTIVSKSTLNFAYYNNGGAFSYLPGMISGQGYTFIGCQLRILGTGVPITINAINGPIYFKDCAFETVPFFNQDYALGYCAFENCVVGNTAQSLLPLGIQTIQGGSFSGTFSYGQIKVRIGNMYSVTRQYNLSAPVPATRLTITFGGGNYVVTVTLNGSGYNQAIIQCTGDELNRVFVNDRICGETNGAGTGLKMLGIVTNVNVGANQFTITYISSWVVSGTHYFLYVWLPMVNVSFRGDVTNGTRTITNVTIVDGSLVDFVSNGGFLISSAYTTSPNFKPNIIRITNWNPGTSTLTVDRNSTTSITNQLFTNTDATLDPGTPTIVAGSAAGSSPTVSIVKGNDRNMQVSITVGTGPSTGTLATVTFSFPLAGGRIPSVSFSPANGNAAALSGGNEVFMDTSRSDSFIISTGSGALGSGTTYLWSIECN